MAEKEQAAPAGNAYRVTSKQRDHWHVREIGTADGFTQDYTWAAGNGHSVTMTPADAERLMGLPDAAEFTFAELAG